MKEYQSNKNIMGKVLLLVDNGMQQYIHSITQDDDIEILILPKNTVSFFTPLFPELINEINTIFEGIMLKKLTEESLVAKEFSRSYNIEFYTKVIGDNILSTDHLFPSLINGIKYRLSELRLLPKKNDMSTRHCTSDPRIGM